MFCKLLIYLEAGSAHVRLFVISCLDISGKRMSLSTEDDAGTINDRTVLSMLFGRINMKFYGYSDQ